MEGYLMEGPRLSCDIMLNTVGLVHGVGDHERNILRDIKTA